LLAGDAEEGQAKIAAVSGNKFSKKCFERAAIPNPMSLAKRRHREAALMFSVRETLVQFGNILQGQLFPVTKPGWDH
jgi:hypothetical protein